MKGRCISCCRTEVPLCVRIVCHSFLMPPKKKNACPSVNPDLWVKSMKPSMTLAMGMKGSQGSSHCWRAQVEGEQRIRANWTALNDPEGEDRDKQALERAIQRESDKRTAYRENNDALQNILLKEGAANPRTITTTYLKARNSLAPQDKYNMPQTSAQDVGWSVPAAMRGDGNFTSCLSSTHKNTQGQKSLAYRRPDEEEHAMLFGYTLDRSYC